MGEFYFFGLCQQTYEIPAAKENGFDHIVAGTLVEAHYFADSKIRRRWGFFKRKHFKVPYVVEYRKYVDFAIDYYKNHYEQSPWMIPCIEPGFDHSPRSSYRGTVFNHSTPEEWGRLCHNVINIAKNMKRSFCLSRHGTNGLRAITWNPISFMVRAS